MSYYNIAGEALAKISQDLNAARRLPQVNPDLSFISKQMKETERIAIEAARPFDPNVFRMNLKTITNISDPIKESIARLNEYREVFNSIPNPSFDHSFYEGQIEELKKEIVNEAVAIELNDSFKEVEEIATSELPETEKEARFQVWIDNIKHLPAIGALSDKIMTLGHAALNFLKENKDKFNDFM